MFEFLRCKFSLQVLFCSALMRTNLERRRELAPAPCQLLGEDLLLSEEGQIPAHHVVQQNAQAPHCQLVRVIPTKTASTGHIKTTLVISGLQMYISSHTYGKCSPKTLLLCPVSFLLAENLLCSHSTLPPPSNDPVLKVSLNMSLLRNFLRS